MRLAALILLTALATTSPAQGFIEVIPEEEISVVFHQPATLRLATGAELRGKVTGITMLSNYISSISFTPDSGGKRTKFAAEQVDRLAVKAGKAAKTVMLNASATSIREAAGADFDKALQVDSLVFETALRASKKDKPRLMQLLNPGFDSVLKVYADPNAKKTLGLSVGGVRFLGGEDKSFLFVQGEAKAVVVKKGSYRENFAELYGRCPAMIEVFGGEKLRWEDVAGHVFVYDRICRSFLQAPDSTGARPPAGAGSR